MEIETTPDNNTVYSYCTGTITKEDMEKVLPILKEKTQRFKKVRWYYQMEDFHGWTPRAFWEDIRFDVKHANDFDKVAMIGEKKWEECMTDLIRPFTPAEAKYFDTSQKGEAMQWI